MLSMNLRIKLHVLIHYTQEWDDPAHTADLGQRQRQGPKHRLPARCWTEGGACRRRRGLPQQAASSSAQEGDGGGTADPARCAQAASSVHKPGTRADRGTLEPVVEPFHRLGPLPLLARALEHYSAQSAPL